MKARLYGYFGHGNLGDEAIQEAWRRAVPSLRRAHVQAPPRLPRGRGVTLFAGGILQDRSSVRSLIFYSAALGVAARGGPCGLAAVGVDVQSRAGRLVLSRAVPKADFASARDPKSYRELADVGAKPREARDVALTLSAPRHQGGGPVLVNLTPAVPPAVRHAVLS
ncbi:MAG: hypothetical protein R6U88_03715, partial [Candidatus Bipolaricaulota bacterium]